MNLALAFLLCGPLAAPVPSPDNLDFGSGTLAGWEGTGFAVGPAGVGPRLACGVCSGDGGTPGRTGLLHRTFVVPPGATVLTCTACAVRGPGDPADANLDVVLLAAGKRVVPKQVRTPSGWVPVGTVLPRQDRRPREYLWQLEGYVGQTLRLALIDEDKRPGCHLVCGGFRLLPGDQFEARDFARHMVALTRARRLPEVARFDSRHFTALSNADDAFSEAQLRHCELLHGLFVEHFRAKGFRLHEPAARLMVAMFDSQAGFEAYVGRALPVSVTGLYHLPSNRLVLYDFGQNRAFADQVRKAEGAGRRIDSDLDRRRFLDTVNRLGQDVRTGVNLTTVMHEAAHQLSFNCGLLRRDGDVPMWLAEGLACYCEVTDNGAWQGVGEPNPDRLRTLADSAGRRLPLRALVAGDDWLRSDTRTVLVGYAESWALFRLLMEEKPAALRAYLELIGPRRTPEHRLADFAQGFGADLDRLERRFDQYVREQVEAHVRPPREGQR